MHTRPARRLSLPRRLVGVVLSAACLGGAPAAAQIAAIDACRADAGGAARIACLETALCRTLDGEDARAGCLAHIAGVDGAASLQDAPAPEPVVAPAAPAAAASVAVVAADEAVPDDGVAEPKRSRFALPGFGGRRDAPAAATVASGSAEAAELGAEALSPGKSERRDKPKRVAATIVSFDYVRDGVLQVELDNGQVWRQIDGDSRRARLRDGDSMAVELWPSGFGGYRLRLVEQGVRLRVRRLQ